MRNAHEIFRTRTTPLPDRAQIVRFATPPIAARERIAPALGATRRIAVMRAPNEKEEALAQVQMLTEAAGAHVSWTETTADPRAIERTIDTHDAVIVSALPEDLPRHRGFVQRFHSAAQGASAFGSSHAPRSLIRPDLLLVGATAHGARAWERSVRLACAWALAEGRQRVHCAVRDPGFPILASDRTTRFRRIAAEHPAIEALRTSFRGARQRLLFEPHSFELLVADAEDLASLARAARMGVGSSRPDPVLYLGDAQGLLDLGPGERASDGDAAVGLALATLRLLRHIGEEPAAHRIGAALRLELAERWELSRDLWLDLASETASRVVAAVLERMCSGQSRPD
jgi:hypothetical protein